MAFEYRKFFLSPGQMPSDSGSTGRCLSDGSIVWIGEEGSWKKDVLENSFMTVAEVEECSKLLEFDKFEQPGEVSFEEFCDPIKFEAAKQKTACCNI